MSLRNCLNSKVLIIKSPDLKPILFRRLAALSWNRYYELESLVPEDWKMVNSYKIISTIIVKMPGKNEGQVVSLGTGNRYVIKILKKKNILHAIKILLRRTISRIFLIKQLNSLPFKKNIFPVSIQFDKIASVVRSISLDERHVLSEFRETFDVIFILY